MFWLFIVIWFFFCEYSCSNFDWLICKSLVLYNQLQNNGWRKTKILIKECPLSQILIKIGGKRWKRRKRGKINRKKNMRHFLRWIMNRFFRSNIKSTVSFRSIMITNYYFQDIVSHKILQITRKLNKRIYSKNMIKSIFKSIFLLKSRSLSKVYSKLQLKCAK
jgi:hypothetical protein